MFRWAQGIKRENNTEKLDLDQRDLVTSCNIKRLRSLVTVLPQLFCDWRTNYPFRWDGTAMAREFDKLWSGHRLIILIATDPIFCKSMNLRS